MARKVIHNVVIPDYQGKITPASAPTRVDTDATFADPASGDVVLDLEHVDGILVIVDFDRVAGTRGEIRAMFGVVDATAELLDQETRQDHSTAGEVAYEKIIHVLGAADIRLMIDIPKQQRFCKIQRQVTVAPTTDAMAIGIIGYKGSRKQIKEAAGVA